MHSGRTIEFNQAPFIAIWEVTQSCALACRHCRAEAINSRHPDELQLDEGKGVIDQVAEMGTHVLIFTGGDPLQRQDLDTLIRHAKSRGLRVGAIPAATERLTAERVRRLKAAGLDQMALSIDGPTAAEHDTFRGVDGSFAHTMAGASFAQAAGLPLQINTVLANWNLERFDAIRDLVESLGVVFWEVFFLIPTGRGAQLQGLTHEQYEHLFAKLYDLQMRSPFIVKITEAPQYRVYVTQQERSRTQSDGPPATRLRSLLARQTGPGGSVGQAPRGVNAGKGFMFVSHTGDVYPSGFLPLSAGNVRQTPIASIYRDSPIFQELRDASLLKGRCGRCTFRGLCGGSRSRVYALSGDYLAEDASCSYDLAEVA